MPKRPHPEREPPQPFERLSVHGDELHRTSSALGELIAMLHGRHWDAIDVVIDAVLHEYLSGTGAHFQRGISHGKWLQEHRVERLNATEARCRDLSAKLFEMQIKLAILQGKYELALKQVATSKPRISNDSPEHSLI